MQDDIRMEKMIEAMYDDLASHLSPRMRSKCPMLKRMAEYLVHMKAENNERIITGFGLMDGEEWDCECIQSR